MKIASQFSKDEQDDLNCVTRYTITVKCLPDQHLCRISQKCIPLEKRCDGRAACINGEDEWDCGESSHYFLKDYTKAFSFTFSLMIQHVVRIMSD
jgi:hypothetical protein